MPALLPARASKDAKKKPAPHKRRPVAHHHKKHKKKHKKKRHRHHHHTPPPSVPPRPDPHPAGGSLPPPPDLDHRNAERLLWRAGLGPPPGGVGAVVSQRLRGPGPALHFPAGPGA